MPTTRTPTRKTRATTSARTTKRSPRVDAIALLKQDHPKVQELFKKFEHAGDGALKQKRKLVDEMISELSQHASIEEQVLSPSEESELFSDLRDVATRAELLDLADALRAAKKYAPTRPHPRGADTPPGNVVTAPIASALDHAREVGRDVVERIGSAKS